MPFDTEEDLNTSEENDVEEAMLDGVDDDLADEPDEEDSLLDEDAEDVDYDSFDDEDPL